MLPFRAFLDSLPKDTRRNLPREHTPYYCDFSSNDYLNLSRHPLVVAAFRDAACASVGSRASRLAGGSHPEHALAEAALARLKGTEGALLLGCGMVANLTVLPALLDKVLWGNKTPIVLIDRLAHHSLLRGVQASGAHWQRFVHNDLDDLRRRLERLEGHQQPFIVAESVYSMDGDIADIAGLAALRREFGAFVYLDEAHATGVFGAGGAGLSPGHGIDVVLGTGGKALGSYGAFIAAGGDIIEYLVQRCAGVIYTTALPPAVAAALTAAAQLLLSLERERAHLHALGDQVRGLAKAAGYAVGASASPIIPLITGGNASALALAERFKAHGCRAPAIRPPTVPQGAARVRLSLTAAMGGKEVEMLEKILYSALRN
jgi:8-amino-7-oxononanoate synthase